MSQPRQSRRRRGSTTPAPALQVVTPTAPPAEQAPAKIPFPAAQPAAPPAAPPPPTPQAPPAAPQPEHDTVVVSPRYCPCTGRPQVGIAFNMRDPNNRREYIIDVTMAEAIADQIFNVCDGHRERYDEQWFAVHPVLAPV